MPKFKKSPASKAFWARNYYADNREHKRRQRTTFRGRGQFAPLRSINKPRRPLVPLSIPKGPRGPSGKTWAKGFRPSSVLPESWNRSNEAFYKSKFGQFLEHHGKQLLDVSLGILGAAETGGSMVIGGVGALLPKTAMRAYRALQTWRAMRAAAATRRAEKSFVAIARASRLQSEAAFTASIPRTRLQIAQLQQRLHLRMGEVLPARYQSVIDAAGPRSPYPSAREAKLIANLNKNFSPIARRTRARTLSRAAKK